jgi:hypothetical protein
MLELEHKKDPVIALIKAIRDDNDISDIMSLLIQPVQRIPRYRLLLEVSIFYLIMTVLIKT